MLYNGELRCYGYLCYVNPIVMKFFKSIPSVTLHHCIKFGIDCSKIDNFGKYDLDLKYFNVRRFARSLNEGQI